MQVTFSAAASRDVPLREHPLGHMDQLLLTSRGHGGRGGGFRGRGRLRRSRLTGRAAQQESLQVVFGADHHAGGQEQIQALLHHGVVGRRGGGGVAVELHLLGGYVDPLARQDGLGGQAGIGGVAQAQGQLGKASLVSPVSTTTP